MSDDTLEFVWNYQHRGDTPFIESRTAHVVDNRDGHDVTTPCGESFTIIRSHKIESIETVDNLPVEYNRCGHCPWDDVAETIGGDA